MRTSLAALMMMVCAGAALGQGYTFELRLVPDGFPGGPTGPWPMYPEGQPGQYPRRVGFWLQGRVMQTQGENWGIVRASAPDGEEAAITSTGTDGWIATLQSGAVDGAQTQYGVSIPYRHGAGDGTLSADQRRIAGFDAFVGATRADSDGDGDGDLDDNADGFPEQPWRINGGVQNPSVDGVPFPLDDAFTPWANLYRFYADFQQPPIPWSGSITIHAHVLLTAAAQTTHGGNGVFTMVPG
ncbi:MAG TPA: hypothetical protein VFF65_03880, partial [Phycisphaerales bacterium]|nr:hypothetical protein [Phycisphaerales bacterium]